MYVVAAKMCSCSKNEGPSCTLPTLQHTATYCNILQRTATNNHFLSEVLSLEQAVAEVSAELSRAHYIVGHAGNAATHCNTL